MTTQEKFLVRFFKITALYNEFRCWHWSFQDDIINIYIADQGMFCPTPSNYIAAEQVTPENIDILEQAFIDCAESGEDWDISWAPALFIGRVRKMSPYPHYYRNMTEHTIKLFQQCGSKI